MPAVEDFKIPGSPRTLVTMQCSQHATVFSCAVPGRLLQAFTIGKSSNSSLRTAVVQGSLHLSSLPGFFHPVLIKE